jgi:hypothetical protein
MLSAKEEVLWKKKGYLHIQNAIPSDLVQTLIGEVDNLRHGYSQTKGLFDIGFDKKFIIAESDIFRYMMDCEHTFPIILHLMGPCLQLSMSQALIRPAGNSFEGFVHTDGGQAMQSVQISRNSKPLQIKIQYFLTDTDRIDSGNFLFKPGSHKIRFPFYEKKELESIKMSQLKAKSGDAVIFSNELWHGATKNKSNKDRKSIIFGYSQMFIRPYDYSSVSESLLNKCTLRQRRLLGDVGSSAPQAHFYAPNDQIIIMEGV